MLYFIFFFFFNDTATTEIYTLSLHDALPICDVAPTGTGRKHRRDLTPRGEYQKRDADKPHGVDADQDPERERVDPGALPRSEEHTSELQSPCNLVCRLLLEKKKKTTTNTTNA